MNSRTLALVINAYNKSKPAFDAVKRGFKGVGNLSKKVTRAIKLGWKAVGKAISVATGFITTAVKLAIIPLTALTLGLVSSVVEAARFEQAMANVASVLGSTGKELDMLSNAAREMGKTSVFTAQEAASAMYDLASAGFNANEVVGALKGTMLLAAATASDLTFTTESVTSTIKQFSLQASDAERVANAFAATISFSKMNMDRLTNAMAYAGPIASGFGHTMEATLSVLAQFANMGLRATQIGTTFRMGLLQLQRAMPEEEIEKGADVLKRLGLSFKDIDPSIHSVADIVEVLHGKVTKMSEAVALFGVRAGGPFLKIIEGGAKPLRDFEKRITGTRKAFEMSAIQLATFYGSLRMFKSAVQAAQESLGRAFLPILTQVIDKFTEFVRIIADIGVKKVWDTFISGGEQANEMLDDLAKVFQPGGSFRNALSETALAMIHIFAKAAELAGTVIGTELQVAFMKAIHAISTELDNISAKIASVTKITKFIPALTIPSVALERTATQVAGGMATRTGPEAQQALRAQSRKDLLEGVRALLETSKREARRASGATGTFLTDLTAALPTKASETATETDETLKKMEKFVELTEETLEQIHSKHWQLRVYLTRKMEIMQERIDKWKMDSTTGIAQVGALH